MKYQTIIFTYTGLIAKNYGVDGSALVEEGVEYTPDNIKDDKIARVWVHEGFAKYKTDDKKVEAIKYEDVSKEELIKEEKEEAEIEEVQLQVEEVQKQAPKKRGRKPKNK